MKKLSAVCDYGGDTRLIDDKASEIVLTQPSYPE